MSAAIRERFLRFHDENLSVYRALERLAVQWRAQRGERQSIQMLYEVLRWQEGLSTTGDPYRLNNDYSPYYARLLMHRNPGFMFEIRASDADIFGHRAHPDQAALWDDAGADLTWLDEADRLLDEPASDDPGAT